MRKNFGAGERLLPLISAAMQTGRFLFLGTGGSLGIPVVGCTCAVCLSPSPCNKRLRPSGLLTVAGKTLLLDAGPDFRAQALKYGVARLDGVLLTHSHFDHIGGFDDLRVFYFAQRRLLPCLLSEDTFDELKIRYHYMMHPGESEAAVCAHFQFHLLKGEFGAVDFEGIKLRYFTYRQGGMQVNGFRVGEFAYVSDIRDYDEEVIQALRGVQTLVLSALRYTPSEVHFSIHEAIAFAKKVGSAHTWFTHIAHDLDHDLTTADLPPGFALGRDGMELTFGGV
jgi:phosphoribosyl 1,2-cyclic phosphate phosphodiesterase